VSQKVLLLIIESQRSCFPLILMFSMFKTAEVLPAN